VQSTPYQPRYRLDPAWLFLLSGLALLCSVVVIGARDEMDDARHQRDRVLAVEQHRQQRIDRYNEYLAALERNDPVLAESLAGSQLNQVPATRAAIPGTVDPAAGDATIFPALEPPPLQLPQRVMVDSTLANLARHDRTRLWLLAASGVLILVGLLPATMKTRG
jgi:hypothetical protein